MLIIEELKSLLPTPSARLSALLTGVLLTPAFLAPPFLKPLLWPTATERELVLLQISATVLVLFIGSFITFLIVRYAKEPKSFWESKP